MTTESLTVRFIPQLKAVYAWLIQRFREQSRPIQFTSVCLALMLVGGVVLRVIGYANPPWFTFDEELFIKNAHAYLMRTPDINDHPPFGKMIQTLGLLALGYNSTGWRFMSVVFGVFTIVLAGMLGQSMFNSKRAGWFAAAFIAADGLFLSYSRTGLLDGLLVCFVLWAMLAATSARSWFGVLLSAVLVGLATTIKWSGVMTVVPAAIAIMMLGRVHWLHVLLFAVVPLVHALVWMWGLNITGQAHDIGSLGKLMLSLYRHHLDMSKHRNELASPWYSWIYMYHPIVVKLSSHGWVNRYSSSLSNLVFVYAGIAGLALLSVGVAIVSSSRKVAGKLGSWYTPELGNGILVAVVGWCAMLAPWTVARKGYVFHYHYMPSFAFLVLLLAGFFAHIERKKAIFAAIFVGLACAVAVFYAPVWAEIPISEKHAHWRLIWRLWRP